MHFWDITQNEKGSLDDFHSRAENIMASLDTLGPFVDERIFSIDIDAKKTGQQFAFHLDYETKIYRQKALASLIRDTVEYFALTHEEFEEFRERGDIASARKKAWGRISKARKDKKGDYGELLLFLLLYFRMAERPERFVTKVRLRSSRGEQIKGFDCAHFTIEEDKPCLWLGEAKFHQNFSGALTSALESLHDHCKPNYLKNELAILGSNIEANHGITQEMCKKLDNLLNKGRSIDKIKFKVPVLLTYDSATVQRHKAITEKFSDELLAELADHLKTIGERNIKLPQNFTLLFLFVPFDKVATLKTDLEKIEEAME